MEGELHSVLVAILSCGLKIDSLTVRSEPDGGHRKFSTWVGAVEFDPILLSKVAAEAAWLTVSRFAHELILWSPKRNRVVWFVVGKGVAELDHSGGWSEWGWVGAEAGS
jgi:hypothetical protein